MSHIKPSPVRSVPHGLTKPSSSPVRQADERDNSRQINGNIRPSHQTLPTALEKPTKLRGDLLCFAAIGQDPRDVLDGSGVTLEEIWALNPLPTVTIANLFDRMVELAPENFGVTCGQSIRVQHLGTLGFVLSNSATVGKLLSDWTRYSLIIGYPLNSSLEIGESYWKMSFHPRYPLSERAFAFCAESTVSGFAASLSNMAGHSVTLERAAFPFPSPGEASIYDSICARYVSFDAGAAYVTGCLSDLDLPIATADPEARAVSEAYLCSELSSATSGQSISERVEKVIAMMHPSFPNEKCVSEMLGLSVRTMQRSLTTEGKTFNALLDRVRRERALRLIRQGVATKVITHDLGYSDVASFSRAFKRWTSERPGQWRITSK